MLSLFSITTMAGFLHINQVVVVVDSIVSQQIAQVHADDNG